MENLDNSINCLAAYGGTLEAAILRDLKQGLKGREEVQGGKLRGGGKVYPLHSDSPRPSPTPPPGRQPPGT